MSAYTTKARVEAVLRPIIDILEAARDRFRLGHSGKISLSHEGLVLSGCKEANDPGMSNHRRLAIQALLASADEHTIDPLHDLLAGVPPLRQSRRRTDGREVSIVMNHCLGGRAPTLRMELTTTLTIDGVEISATTPNPGPYLINELYVFIRTHENFEMSPDLHPYHLVPVAHSVRGPIFADTAEHALLRYAACNRALRSDLKAGKPFGCVQADAPVPKSVIDGLSKKTRKDAAKQPESFTLHNACRH